MSTKDISFYGKLTIIIKYILVFLVNCDLKICMSLVADKAS